MKRVSKLLRFSQDQCRQSYNLSQKGKSDIKKPACEEKGEKTHSLLALGLTINDKNKSPSENTHTSVFV